MGRPRADARKPATSERLLDAAEAEFAKVGFEAARLEDIAGAAGISRPSLLYHFDTKDALYEAVVHAVFGRLASAIAQGLNADGDFAAKVDATVEHYLAFLDANPHVARIVLRELLDGRGPGRKLFLNEASALLQVIEGFIRKHGGRALQRVPVREAVLQIAFGALVRSGAGDLREPLFGARDNTLALARLLFMQGA